MIRWQIALCLGLGLAGTILAFAKTAGEGAFPVGRFFKLAFSIITPCALVAMIPSWNFYLAAPLMILLPFAAAGSALEAKGGLRAALPWIGAIIILGQRFALGYRGSMDVTLQFEIVITIAGGLYLIAPIALFATQRTRLAIVTIAFAVIAFLAAMPDPLAVALAGRRPIYTAINWSVFALFAGLCTFYSVRASKMGGRGRSRVVEIREEG
jgi:hypothetical protein